MSRRARKAFRPVADPVLQGLEHFRASRLGPALDAWGRVRPQPGTPLAQAVAEARLRRVFQQAEAGRKPQPDDFAECLRLAPDDGRALYHLGLAHLRRNQARRAAVALGQAADRLEENGRARYHEALAWLHGGDAAQAERIALVAADAGGAWARRLRLLAGVAALQQGHLEDAADRVAGLTDAAALTVRAASLLLGGDAVAGLAQLREAGSAADPAVQGFVALAAGDEAAATAALQQARAAGCEDALVVEALRALHLRGAGRGDVADALERWEAALDVLPAKDPTRPDVARRLWEAASRRAGAGDWSAARRGFEKASRVLSGERDLVRHRALAAEALEDWRTAADLWKALASDAPRGGQAALTRRWAEALERDGGPGAALPAWRRLSELEPADLDLREKVAEAMLHSGQTRAGRVMLRDLCKAAPDRVAPRLLLAEELLDDNRGRDDAEAEALLAQALALDVDNPRARRMLADAIHGRAHGPEYEPAECLRLMQQAAGVDPSCLDVRCCIVSHLLQTKRQREGLQAAEALVAELGRDPETWVELIRTMSMTLAERPLKPWVGRACEALQEHPAALAGLAARLLARHAGAARLIADELTRRHPNHARGHSLRAAIAWGRRRQAEARAHALAALQAAGHDPILWRGLLNDLMAAQRPLLLEMRADIQRRVQGSGMEEVRDALEGFWESVDLIQGCGPLGEILERMFA